MVGNLALIKTRNCYRFVGSCSDWDSKVIAPESVWSELYFWHGNLNKYACRSLVTPLKSQFSPMLAAQGEGPFFLFMVKMLNPTWNGTRYKYKKVQLGVNCSSFGTP